MVKCYHGTLDVYLLAIKRDGLKPVPGNAWRIHIPDADSLFEQEDHDGVFLTLIEGEAYTYAITKARYARTLPGKSVDLTGTSFEAMSLIKDVDGPSPFVANPIVLTIEVPDTILTAKIALDPHSATPADGFRYLGTLDPKYIKQCRQVTKEK